MAVSKGNTGLPIKLPSYIIERNARAVSAGLVIEKQRGNANTLNTAYRGTPAAFLASGFVDDRRDKFLQAVTSPTKHIGAWAVIYSPARLNVFAHFYRIKDSEEIRMTISREVLARREWTPAPGVKAFEVLHDWKGRGIANVYEARSFAILHRAGLLPANAASPLGGAKMLRDDRGTLDSNDYYVAWELIETEDAVRLAIYPEGMKRAQRADRDKNKWDHKSAKEYHESLSKGVELHHDCIEIEIDGAVTKHGKMYSLDKKTVERIQLLHQEIKDAIASATLITARDPDLVEEDKANQKRAADYQAKAEAAAQDQGLRLFLQKSFLRVEGKPKGRK